MLHEQGHLPHRWTPLMSARKGKCVNNLKEVYTSHGNVINLQAAESESRRVKERPLFTKIA